MSNCIKFTNTNNQAFMQYSLWLKLDVKTDRQIYENQFVSVEGGNYK